MRVLSTHPVPTVCVYVHVHVCVRVRLPYMVFISAGKLLYTVWGSFFIWLALRKRKRRSTLLFTQPPL